ncbi:hypothetical protein V8E36_008902 [Tilletia maclaganii]
MASHNDKVHYKPKSALLLVAFAEPESYQWSASSEQLVELARCLDNYAPLSTLLSLYRDEASSTLSQLQNAAGQDLSLEPSTFSELVKRSGHKFSATLALTLQLGLYILFAKRYHGKVQLAGLLESETNAAAVLSYGIGRLGAKAIGSSRTVLQLVENSVAAVAFAAELEALSVKAESGLKSIHLEVQGGTSAIENLRTSHSTLRTTAAPSFNELVLTGSDAEIDSFVQQIGSDAAAASSIVHWNVRPAGLVASSAQAGHAALEAPAFDRASSSAVSRVTVLGDSDISAANAQEWLTAVQARGSEETGELVQLGKLIHREFTVEDSLADTASGLVDVLCVGPWRSFEQTVIARLHQVEANIRSVDLAASLFNAAHYTDIDALPTEYSAVSYHPQSHIAVVGYSLRVPGASDPDQFWDLLSKGRDMHSDIPKHLFDLDLYHNVQYRVKNTMRTRSGNFLSEPGLFDIGLFGITEEQAKQMDPQHRNAFLAAYEALEMSGYSPFSSIGRETDGNGVGVFVGGAGDDYRECCSWKIEEDFIAGNSRQSVSGSISNFFGFHGPSHTYDTACSSSLVAVEAACQNIVSGRCRTALAGGVSVLTQPQVYVGLDRGYFLTKNQYGQCQTFDDGGDGYSRADANAFIHIKLFKDALRDGDDIKGVIKAIGTNHSGKSHSITHPHAPTQARLFDANCKSARLEPRHINLVEMHGTGTQAGDANEIESVISFARGRRQDDGVLTIGSVKANLGHSEAASGCVALIKVLLSLEQRKCVPHIGIKNKLNTKFPSLEGVLISKELIDLPVAADKPIIACCNNFSAAGGNSSLFVQTWPRSVARVSTTGPQLVALSGATPQAVKNYAARLLAYLNANPDLSDKLEDVIFSLTATRPTGYKTRAALLLHDASSLPSALEQSIEAQIKIIPDASELPEISFMFTGQGSQYLDMGVELYERNSTFRDAIEKCRSHVISRGLPDFFDAVYPSKALDKNGEAAPPKPYHWQCAIFATEVALYELWAELGIKPRVVAGHSLGDYAALYAAKVLSLADAMFLVAVRAKLMEEKCERNASGMLAVQMPRDEAVKIVEATKWSKNIEVACVNSPTDTVLAGPIDDILGAHQHFKELKKKCMLIDVPYAFHSAAVQPVMDDFRTIASKVTFRAPACDILSSVHGRVVQAGEKGVFSADYMVRHMRDPVLFSEAMLHSVELGKQRYGDDSTRWVEVGPHPICTPMIKSCFAAVGITPVDLAAVLSLRKQTDASATFLKAVKTLYEEGFPIDFKPLFAQSRATKVPLPFYAWEYGNYWIPYRDRHLSTKLIEERKNGKTGGQKKTKRGKGTSKKSTSKTLGVRTDFALLTRCISAASTTIPQAQYHIDLNESPSKEIIQGHLVHDVCLVPASMYSDVALQAGLHVLESLGSKFDEKTHALQVLDILMDEPVVLGVHSDMHLHTHGLPTDINGMTLTFYFADGRRQGGCAVRIVPREQVETRWTGIRDLLSRRVESLRAAQEGGARLTTQMAYNLFTKVVDYNAQYRAMQEVFLNEAGDEAALHVQLQTAPCLADESRRFVVFPVYQDSVGQCTGFLPNLQADSEHVYIANGCKLIEYTSRMIDVAKPGNKVWVHCSMQEDEGLSTSDAYFFDEKTGEVVGHMGGVKFRKIPLRVMKHVMPKPGTTPRVIGNGTPVAKDTRSAHLPARSAPAPPVPAPTPLAAPATPSAAPQAPAPAPAATTTPTKTEPDAPVQTPGKSESRDSNGGNELFLRLREIIITELAVEESELTNDRNLADLGLDSLMSLMILGNLQESASIEVSSSLFMDCPTIGAVEAYFAENFGGGAGSSVDSAAGGGEVPTPTSTPSPSLSSPVTHFDSDRSTPASSIYEAHAGAADVEVVTLRPAKSGSEKAAPIVLLPEGTGSPHVYSELLDAGFGKGGQAILGVGLKTSSDSWSVEEVASSIASALNLKLGGSKCVLAGWSLGGVLAYTLAAKDLVDVAGVVLIDMPPATPKLQAFPPELLEHFIATYPGHSDNFRQAARAGAAYSRAGLKRVAVPTLFVRGTRAASIAGVAAGAHWIVSERPSGSPTGWEDAFGNMHVVDLSEADHFSVVKKKGGAAKLTSDSVNAFLELEV